MTKIGSFKSLERSNSVRAYNRMSKDLKNLRMAERRDKENEKQSEMLASRTEKT